MVKKPDATEYFSKGSKHPNSLRKYELFHLVRVFIKSDKHIALDIGESLIAYELKNLLPGCCQPLYSSKIRKRRRINCCHD